MFCTCPISRRFHSCNTQNLRCCVTESMVLLPVLLVRSCWTWHIWLYLTYVKNICWIHVKFTSTVFPRILPDLPWFFQLCDYMNYSSTFFSLNFLNMPWSFFCMFVFFFKIFVSLFICVCLQYVLVCYCKILSP